MDWIKLPKRLAIYHRDLFDCVWCEAVFPIDPLGYGLTLDHLNSTTNHNPANLVTCCKSCNSVKRDLSLHDWYRRLEKEEGRDIRRIQRRIQRLTRKRINLEIGKWLAYARRPSYRQKHEREMGWLDDVSWLIMNHDKQPKL
jgi:hypothetical protein